MNSPKTVTYPVKFEEQEDGSWMALCRDLRPEGEHAFLTDGDSLEDARVNAADALDEILYQYTKKGISMPPPSEPKEEEELITSKCDDEDYKENDTKHVSLAAYEALQAAIEKESYADGDDEFDKACVQVAAKARIEELEAEIAKLQKEQDKRQKETDALVLELRQYVERYRNANTRAIAAEMEFAEFVRNGVLKRIPGGYEPALSREHIDETVFMCKLRANKMAEALHKYKYQKNNAYANDEDREDAETEYMTALQLFNDSFSAL